MNHHLAQLNITRMRAPLDDPLMERFVAWLEPINALADESPGFIWRLQDDEGNATSIRAFEDDRILVNMSVWESLDAFRAFVFRSDHARVMSERAQWFEPPDAPTTVLWWVPEGYTPTVDEGKKRLDLLREEGPSENAFRFSQSFPPPA